MTGTTDNATPPVGVDPHPDTSVPVAESPEPPGAAERAGADETLAATVETLRLAVHQNATAYAHQEELVDRLHRDNEALRAAAQQRVQDPMVRELIAVADTCRNVGQKWLKRQEASPADLDTTLRNIALDIVVILEHHGVDEFTPEVGFPFDRRVARVVATVPNIDPTRSSVVAEVRRPAFLLGDRVLRHAEVVVWAHAAPE